MTSNLAFQVRFLVGLPFYWFVVKWPNTTGFDPVIRRFKSYRTYHIVLYPLLHTSSDGYSPETSITQQKTAGYYREQRIDHRWGVFLP